MNTGKRLQIFTAALAISAALSLPSQAAPASVAEFDTGDEQKKFAWSVVDDGVMGGRSKGKVSIDDGKMLFRGNLSLENNGGFSSLRSQKLKLDLSDASGFTARVKGDGRTYQMRIGTEARYRGMEVSFMAEFPTKEGEWSEVTVPFSKFTGSFRGMKLSREKFDPSAIRRIGLLLADKKAGPFELQVDWIRVAGASSESGGANNIVAAALADGRFKTLAAALTEAELVKVLQGEGPFTVFAPTDEAFAKLPKGTVAELLKSENRDKLQAILKYHVVAGSVDLATALKAGEAATVQGDTVKIAFSKGKVRVNNSAIIDADVKTSNGVIHVVDSVLLPPEKKAATDLLGVANSAGQFKTLLAAVEAAGLTSVLEGDGPFTILAPTDEAFAALPKGTVETLLKKENLGQLKAVLTYHAFAGKVSAGDALNAKSANTLNGNAVEFGIKDGSFKANGATIRITDIQADNGVIHVIDTVLLPPSEKASTQQKCGDSKKVAMAPSERIEAAIDRGVPVFNKGDHSGCADIYKACLEDLAADEQIGKKVRQTLDAVLKHATKEDSARDRAWVYRRGLDFAYDAVSE